MSAGTAAGLTLEVDLEHGGRWTSLRSGEREWLWTNPDAGIAAARPAVRPGDAFVDAGGAEECFPCVRGVPDHGDVWSRGWAGSPDDARVELPDGTGLRRRVSAEGAGLRVDHEITGRSGTRFVHAVHALLDVSASARLVLPGAATVLVLDDGDEGRTAQRAWPSGLDLLGPDDGTATCVIVPGCREATVVDGSCALRFAWDCPARPALCSLMLWRNLGGWPAGGPYRSIGVEPMLGRAADLATGTDEDVGQLDATGRARWTLHIDALAPSNP